MKKILFVIISLVAITCMSCKQGHTYNCQWCNDSICQEGCQCDSSFNCQDTVAWGNTCDSLFQADWEYYEQILKEMEDAD